MLAARNLYVQPHLTSRLSSPLLRSTALLNHYPSLLCSPRPLAALRVLRSRRLACLQLVQVPPADRQVALVLIHASPEVLDVGPAYRWWLVVAVHGVLAVLVLRHGLRGLGCWCSGGRATSEEATDGVADAGTYCYTTRSLSAEMLHKSDSVARHDLRSGAGHLAE